MNVLTEQISCLLDELAYREKALPGKVYPITITVHAILIKSNLPIDRAGVTATDLTLTLAALASQCGRTCPA